MVGTKEGLVEYQQVNTSNARVENAVAVVVVVVDGDRLELRQGLGVHCFGALVVDVVDVVVVVVVAFWGVDPLCDGRCDALCCFQRKNQICVCARGLF